MVFYPGRVYTYKQSVYLVLSSQICLVRGAEKFIAVMQDGVFEFCYFTPNMCTFLEEHGKEEEARSKVGSS